jgi:hypothetical protein
VAAEWNAQRTGGEVAGATQTNRSMGPLGATLSGPDPQQQDIHHQMTLQQHGDPVPSPSDGWNGLFSSVYRTMSFQGRRRPSEITRFYPLRAVFRACRCEQIMGDIKDRRVGHFERE